MRVFLLTLLALVAFASNSVLNRAGLAGGGIDAASFLGIRMLSGAAMLAALVVMRGQGRALAASGSWGSALALLVYAVAFSFAYRTLDAGTGALILFGGVQITMFGGALIARQRVTLLRWVGSGLGMAGLSVLFLPGAGTPSAVGSALMLAAAIGWGIYSLRGQRTGDPLRTTAGNFLRATPPAVAIWIAVWPGAPDATGVALAVASGALASGLGYAVWYTALPMLDSTLAAIAQLTVPLIALGGGMVFLGEVPDAGFAIASALILGGVALALVRPRAPT